MLICDTLINHYLLTYLLTYATEKYVVIYEANCLLLRVHKILLSIYIVIHAILPICSINERKGMFQFTVDTSSHASFIQVMFFDANYMYMYLSRSQSETPVKYK